MIKQGLAAAFLHSAPHFLIIHLVTHTRHMLKAEVKTWVSKIILQESNTFTALLAGYFLGALSRVCLLSEDGTMSPVCHTYFLWCHILAQALILSE